LRLQLSHSSDFEQSFSALLEPFYAGKRQAYDWHMMAE